VVIIIVQFGLLPRNGEYEVFLNFWRKFEVMFPVTSNSTK